MKPYYQTDLGTLYHGDCLEILPQLEKESVDLVLTDPPYEKTSCKWDSTIPLESMWEQVGRLIKTNGIIVLTTSQPFTSFVIMSNLKMFKYDLIWEKSKASGFLNSKKMPLRAHETLLIFYNKSSTYNPQMSKGKPFKDKRDRKKDVTVYRKNMTFVPQDNKGERYPRSVIRCAMDNNTQHPTQKPITLMEYVIKTYTNMDDMVLDFTLGSGTTAVAAERLGRRWIGIEISKEYCDIAVKRIEEERSQLKLSI